MALKQYFYIVLVPLKFIPKRTASFWQTIKIPNRFVLKICTGGFADYSIARLPVAQESAKIQGLLIDLRKDENISYVETLGLAAYLDELEKENNAYISLTSQRTQNRAANKKESGAVLRERIDGYYEDLVMLAQSYSVAVPSEAATAFVNNLNQLITETTTANNQRKKRSGSNGNGADDSERPGELSV